MKIRKLKSAEDIKKFLESSKTEYVKVAITDIDGILRGKYMHVDKFIKSSKKGFGFCDVIFGCCLLYTSPSPRDVEESRMPSSA